MMLPYLHYVLYTYMYVQIQVGKANLLCFDLYYESGCGQNMFSVGPILSIGDMKPFQDGQDWFGITVLILLFSVMSDITGY